MLSLLILTEIHLILHSGRSGGGGGGRRGGRGGKR
jgi:hypothetical protein